MKKILFILGVVVLQSCMQPTIITTGTTRPAISVESVKLYNEQNVPEGYEIVGEINSKSEASFGRKGANNRNIDKVKLKAASVGANGILIRSSSHKSTVWDDSMELNAIAIFVK